jgi:hypothetical protein
MNYLYEILAFERWLEGNHLPSLSQLIWYKLIYINSRCGWQEWVSVDNNRLMLMTSCESVHAVIRARDKLIEQGLIEYEKGRKSVPNKYKLISLSANFTVEMNIQSQYNRNTNEHPNAIETVNINKQEHKHKQNIKENNTKEKTDSENKSTNFKPPTVDEVQAYCSERKNGIDSQRFVDFYASKGWLIGKNKMKDWKAAVRTWENKQKQEQPKQESSFDTNEFFELALKRSYEKIKE